MLIAPTQSSSTTIGITNLMGYAWARSGTAISVEPNPEMPKMTYAVSTTIDENARTAIVGIGRV